ncbi:GNAT family N-acetyltransferase [Candidatus Bipolaricaulota bacterium]|nr:GNAT family N-acetyltransferase [Candidatus Bipolaricaulota bacterium]
MFQEAEPSPSYSVEQLDKTLHDRSGFNCGVEDLDKYLRKYANQDLERGVSTPYVLTKGDGSDIIGYYTLSNYLVDVEIFSADVGSGLPYAQIPATLLGRLAVDQQYQGNRLGKALLFNALKRRYAVAEDIASFTVVVEATNEEAREFYLHYRFQSFPEDKDKLYLPVRTVEEII